MNDRSKQVAETLRVIARERENCFADCGPMVLDLLRSYQAEGVPSELIWQELPANREVSDVADLLGLWCWYTDDNGSEIMRSAEAWISECSNPEKVAVALQLEAYPFLSAEKMKMELARVAERFPNLRERCEALVRERERGRA